MRRLVHIALLLCCAFIATNALNTKLKCGVCTAFVDAVQHGIDTTPDNHEVIVRFRLDERKKVPYARTEYRLLEILEQVCNNMTGKYGVTGPDDERRLVRLDAYYSVSGSNFESGATVNRDVEAICHDIRDDHEEAIVPVFQKSEPNPHSKICVSMTKMCSEKHLARIFEAKAHDEIAAREEEEEEAAEAARAAEAKKAADQAAQQTQANAPASESVPPAAADTPAATEAAPAADLGDAGQSVDSAKEELWFYVD